MGYYSLSPGHWKRWLPNRLRRRIMAQKVAFGARTTRKTTIPFLKQNLAIFILV